MSLAKGLAGSVIGAAVGGGVWLGLSAASGWGLGLMGIIIGGLAGFGMAQGTQGRGGVQGGLAAGAVALVAVLGFKFAVIQVLMRGSMEEHTMVTEEDAVDALAAEHFERMSANGSTFEEWDQFEEEWPQVVQYRADLQWSQMSEFDREALVGELREERRAEAAEAAPVVGLVAFLFSTLRPSGLLLLGLALSTAYKLGSMSVPAEAAGEAAVATAEPAPAHSPFMMPIPEEVPDDGLPTMEEIRRKHAAAEGGGPAGAEAA